MILFLALCCVGVAIAGFSAFVIFWPLTLIHLRDRHPELHARFGPGAFLGAVPLQWLVRRGYLAQADRSLDGLASPARIALFTLLAGLALAALFWLISQVSA
jgi:hypothetical protein